MFRKKSNQKKSNVVLILMVAFFFMAAGVLKLLEFHWPIATVALKGETLNVLVAKTPKHRFRGLGKRQSLEPYDGMLFLFYETGRHAIVMRDMRFPIDVVWLDNGVVVDFAPHLPVEPGVSEFDFTAYYPRKPANVVLELPAGWTLEYGLEIGDRLEVVQD